MLLIIHAGLHKSASTFLQDLLFLNGDLLRSRHVYFEPDAMMRANHGTAWMTLLGDFRHVQAHLLQAARFGHDAAILSSEDFETLVFDAARARQVEAAARAGGATEIEWHFCLRDPGDYFASMYSELSKHTFGDYLAMLAGALRDGRLHIERENGRNPLYWDLCFDYEAHLTAFASAIGGKVVVHDFRDSAPFPGHGVVERLIGVDPELELPGPASRNHRLPPEQVEANFGAKLDAIGQQSGLSPRTTAALKDYLRFPAELQDDCREAISGKFAPGMERLFAHGVALLPDRAGAR
jgi:hypothetical protein